MVEITYQMVLSTLQTIALIVGIAYYLIIMRNSQRAQQLQIETRQAQLFMGVYNQMQETSLQRAWSFLRDHVTHENIRDYLDPEHPDYEVNRAHFTRLSGFFEGLGTLVREGLVPIRLVALMMQGMVRTYWEKIEDYCYEVRKGGYLSALSEAEYLYKALMRYIEENPDFYKS
jgi:hypothetical protein